MQAVLAVRVAELVASRECGELRSVRMVWNRPKSSATGREEMWFDTLADMVHGAKMMANAKPEALSVETAPRANIVFALLRFVNGVVAELEINEELPASMPDICTVKANFSGGHYTNQPLAGYFNEDGLIVADDGHCEQLIIEGNGFAPVRGAIEQMKQRFEEACRNGSFPAGPLDAPEIGKLIAEAVR